MLLFFKPRCFTKMRKREGQVASSNDVEVRKEFHNDVDATVKAGESVRIGKHLWVPIEGMKVTGKYDVISQQLQETAFGLDLHGIAVASTKKGSEFPVAVEIVHY